MVDVNVRQYVATSHEPTPEGRDGFHPVQLGGEGFRVPPDAVKRVPTFPFS